ncbi:MAG: radical SAM protein [Planctomycetes bacterium]|nr:radical SAM protein [Planctomycetota bacterium]MBU1518438.1 radical SAM protein [Planctomycetota bacterium]MBU2596852.1 radical SAM protein [Planctomycetota bacterium]
MKDKPTQKSGHIFGPVPSRRLGRSLGIDLIPSKTCTFDCLYCQVGLTTLKTIERKSWIPVDEIIAELKDKLSTKPDCITLSGSGEPTLYSNCGRLIGEIKKITSVPIAVITNGSLLFMPDVRKDIKNADIVIPSLDAGDEETFKKINRPATGITFDKVLRGLVDFRREFTGKYWLEVFLVAGLNDSDEQIDKLAACIEKIRPDKVQLNTVTRPPAEDVRAVSHQRLEQIAQRIYKNTEVIADFKSDDKTGDLKVKSDDIVEMLKRRPCSVEDIASGLKMSKLEVLKHIEKLISSGRIEPVRQNDRIYYKVV